MKINFAKGGSLAALALALSLALPTAPAEAQDRGDRRAAARAEARAERPAVRSENRGGRGEARINRSAQPARADARPNAVQPRGFGADVVRRAQQAERAQRVDRRSEVRAQQVDRRSEVRANQVDRRSEVRAAQVERRGDVRADQLDRRGRDGAAQRVDRRSEAQAAQIERRGDFRANRIENRGDRRADRIEDRGDRRVGRVDNRQTDWRDGRRDGARGNDWRNDRRGDVSRRSNWRRDDWRWNWQGRPGWDRRDFRRWDNRWRSNRSYNYLDFRRSNRFIFSPGPYYAPFRSHRYSRLQSGFFLDSLFFQPRFFLNDPGAYRLPPVYGPYQWVRYYDDVVLVDIYTGEVVDVIYDFFW